MSRVWLLLLLTHLLKAQVTQKFLTGEILNSSDTSTNSSGTTELFPTEPPEVAGKPSEAPTVVEDDWSPAETFLYTGNTSTLKLARCSRPYSTQGQNGPLPNNFFAPLQPALNALTNTANFLNMVFQASDLRESTVQEDMEWYHALVRALLEADMVIQRALITFDADPTAQVPQLVLHATRNPSAKQETIVLQDFSKAWESLHPPAPAPDDSWFTRLKFSESNQQTASLSKRVLLNDLSTLDTPKWGQGDSYVTDHSGVRWASAPYLDCKDGRFVPGWVLTLSISFYGLKPDLTPEFRGVIRVDVNIQGIDLNQCATGDSWFADTHQCNRTTMECVPVSGRGFRLGQYCCRCKEGYYNPDIPPEDLDGGPVNSSDSSGTCYPNMPICLPCWPGCKSCQDSTPCWVQEDRPLRAGVLALQGVFMFLILVSMMVAYRHRQNRRIRASGLLLLETILFGSLLLYFPVFILYFKPSTFRCILLRWVRLLGFFIVYGTITLKMYRVLKVFLSRTAQRMPYMSSLHLLRILGVMLMTVSWFLCAWTVGVLQNRDRNIPVFVTATTSDGQSFNLCYLDRWDYMMAVAELLFLCWGSSLWTAVRPVPSAFHEPRYMGIAIHNELVLSSMFHLFRFTFQSLHPDWMLLLSFTHTHVTITMTLVLLFVPKFIHASKPAREEVAAEVYEDEVDLRRSASCLNNSFRSAWSEHSMDPDDFRDELKKLYTQLEVNKTKKMTANNPHLSKKRSSRCTLGRSLIKRIAEFPETVSRRCSRDDRDGSFRSRRGSHCDSFRRSPDTISISYRSSIKSPSPSIRKSQSDHFYIRERGSSFRETTLKSNSVKRSSQRSETDSLDIPPGVCKSASAHNLTIDTNLLHPDHTRLHKSWSLSSSTTHSIENISKLSRSSTMRSRQSISISDQTRSALQSESFDKAEICPWEVEPEQPGEKNQKHVTYANSKNGEEKGPLSPQAIVCPWDHLPTMEKAHLMEKGPQAASVYSKAPVTVSASAPGSPRPKVKKDQRVFSFRTTTNKWLHVRSFMTSMDSSKSKDQTLNRDDSGSQKSQESMSTTPRSGTSSRCPSIERRTLQKKSMSTIEGKPCLVKQHAVRLSSTDSSDRSPRRFVLVKSAIYPGEIDDIQKDGNYEHVFLSRQSSKRSSISSWETISSSRTPSTRRRGSNRIRPASNVTYTDHYDAGGFTKQGEVPRKEQSTKASTCPQELQVSERSNVCSWESQEQGNLIGQEIGRELQDTSASSTTTVLKDPHTQQSIQHVEDVCPWEAAETPQISIRQDSEHASVCPWDVKDKADVVYENLNSLETKGTLAVPFRQEAMKPTIYPGSSREVLSSGSLPNTLNQSEQWYKIIESCPWDFPDPPKTMEDVFPWKKVGKELTNTDLSLEMTPKIDINRETRNQSKLDVSTKFVSIQNKGTENARVNVCPWETELPEQNVATKMVSQGLKQPSDPWENEEPKSANPETPKKPEICSQQDNARANVCPWETKEYEVLHFKESKSSESGTTKVTKEQENAQTDVCSRGTKESKIFKKQDSNRSDVCPWETEEPRILKKKDSALTDICPWETEEPRILKKKNSALADVCPRETEEPRLLKKKNSALADVCPWETEEPRLLKKKNSALADVCPRETEEPRLLKKKNRALADVCPWETEEPRLLKKKNSALTDVCPWETEEPRILKKKDSALTDVCPQETEEPRILKKKDSALTDVCPRETEEPRILKKKDSALTDVTKKQDIIKADVCPWETEELKVLKKQDSTKADVCPWETEEPKMLKKQDSSRADVCPWETVDTKDAKEQDDTRENTGSLDGNEPGDDRKNYINGAEKVFAANNQNEGTDIQSPLGVNETLGDVSTEQTEEAKSSLALGRRDALCPWEIIRSASGSFADNASDVFTWDPENIPEEDEEGDAECAAEALVFPPDL